MVTISFLQKSRVCTCAHYRSKWSTKEQFQDWSQTLNPSLFAIWDWCLKHPPFNWTLTECVNSSPSIVWFIHSIPHEKNSLASGNLCAQANLENKWQSVFFHPYMWLWSPLMWSVTTSWVFEVCRGLLPIPCLPFLWRVLIHAMTHTHTHTHVRMLLSANQGVNGWAFLAFSLARTQKPSVVIARSQKYNIKELHNCRGRYMQTRTHIANGFRQIGSCGINGASTTL